MKYKGLIVGMEIVGMIQDGLDLTKEDIIGIAKSRGINPPSDKSLPMYADAILELAKPENWKAMTKASLADVNQAFGSIGHAKSLMVNGNLHVRSLDGEKRHSKSDEE